MVGPPILGPGSRSAEEMARTPFLRNSVKGLPILDRSLAAMLKNRNEMQSVKLLPPNTVFWPIRREWKQSTRYFDRRIVPWTIPLPSQSGTYLPFGLLVGDSCMYTALLLRNVVFGACRILEYTD